MDEQKPAVLEYATPPIHLRRVRLGLVLRFTLHTTLLSIILGIAWLCLGFGMNGKIETSDLLAIPVLFFVAALMTRAVWGVFSNAEDVWEGREGMMRWGLKCLDGH